MKLAVLALAFVAVALGIFALTQPYRGGMIGFDFRTLDNGDPVVTRVYPQSSAQQQGLRAGDVIALTRLTARENFAIAYSRAGQPLTLPLVRDGKVRLAHIVTTEYTATKPLEQGPLALIVLMLFAATGVLVALRGAGKIAHWLALFFVAYAMQMAFYWYANVASSPALSFSGNVLGSAASWVNTYMLLLIVCNFPPFTSPFRTVLRRMAFPLIAVAAAVQLWIYAAFIVPAAQLTQIAGSAAPLWLQSLVWIFISIVLLGGAFEGMLRAGEDHRAQMRWVGGALILSQLGWLPLNVSLMIDPNPQPWFPWMSLFQDVPLLAIAYAVLRHRLVDLTIVFSRAAIFGFVSITLVALFIAGEWVAAQIVERGLGADVARGWVGKAVPLAIALGVGLSARSIHAAVEGKLNAFFFGKREKAMAALRRLALEADVVTDTRSLLDLVYGTVRENIEGTYAGIYLEDGNRYELKRGTHAPGELGVNDPVIVRLRRWNEPFEMELGEHPLSEALLLPMTVRGALLGALVCGPKRERTHYLNEEIDALALVAHRAGTAYELLTREGPRYEGVDIGLLRELIRAEMQALQAQPT
ncbi:MAG TPA: hypothetical protein VFW34_01175 [Candidatus Rubrimentiphilum sp.]|nr:hypothetical protein [Candidatus Rubrimentiphilum sp.]